MAAATYTLAADGTFTDARTGVPAQFKAGHVLSLEEAVLYGMPGAAFGVVATADGGGSGALAAGGFSAVASGNADHVVVLPDPVPGTVVALRNGATGYELRSSAPTTVAINGGSGSGAESAIAAEQLVVCVCDTASSWLCSTTATDGTVGATEAAA